MDFRETLLGILLRSVLMFGSEWKNKDTLHEDLGTFMLMSCLLREKKCGTARHVTEVRDNVDIIWGHTDTT